MQNISLIKPKQLILFSLIIGGITISGIAQNHPHIYISDQDKPAFLLRLKNDSGVNGYVNKIQQHLASFVARHQSEPEWVVSRLQMYWNTKYTRVFVNGMDFSHGEGSAPVPTVRFSGSRDWDTDYLTPEIEDILPYMDDNRGLYLQNGEKPGKPWEWVHPAETGHIIEKINREILDLAQDAAFLYWLNGEEKYAIFAADIFMTYIEGMYYRDPPETIENHHNQDLMGLQTFEVIHEGVIKPVTLCYDFLYSYLAEEEKDLNMIQAVFRKWADQEIKYGVPGNNWNLMQARYISYLALALEDDPMYEDGKGQQYYIDQVLNQNSRKQKALKDVMKNFDPNTGIWPEVAHYSIMVSDDILEVIALLDHSLNNHLLEEFPMLEKAILANFNYLFPNGFTTAYGDAKHARLRFRALELLISQYRKYGKTSREELITRQLKRFIEDGAYEREDIGSLFHLFFYVEKLADVSAAESFAKLLGPTFYSPNVSWIVQRNGHSPDNGMVVSKNASLGNHSHANGINLELFAKGMVIAPDGAAGVSYWSEDHRNYYSRFPAHNTVVVDGISDYRTMNSVHAFKVNSLYPSPDTSTVLMGDITFSDVSFHEPASNANQHRLTGTIRTSPSSGYFVDIFRSARQDQQDKKHEYLFHGQGGPILLTDFRGNPIALSGTEELSSQQGDLPGYNYFTNKRKEVYTGNFIAQYQMPSILDKQLNVKIWMKGYEKRTLFVVDAPYSRAIHPETVPEELYHKTLPTLIVRQEGEAKTRPFVAIIDAFNQGEENKVTEVQYFAPVQDDPGFVGISVHSENQRTDYIYHHHDSTATQSFADGLFCGTYGVISYQNSAVHSIFLGSGTAIEKAGYSIKTAENAGTILVKFIEGGLEIDAVTPFTLRIPISKKEARSPKLAGKDESENPNVWTGKVYKTAGQTYVEFELPTLKTARLTKENW